VDATGEVVATFRVLTWDTDLQEFTPQDGVDPGPYTLFGLRPALRQLREMGYGGWQSPCVLVDRVT
jgi:hypothetical protein